MSLSGEVAQTCANIVRHKEGACGKKLSEIAVMLRFVCVKFCILTTFAIFSSMVTAADVSTTKQSAKFPEKINHFLTTYCVSCHGPEKAKSDLRLDTISQDLVSGPHAEDWHEVLDALNKGEMPPDDKKQPSEAERIAVIDFLTGAFKEAAVLRRNTGGKVVMRRLTNYEYNNTLNELLALDENWSKDFPPRLSFARRL